MHQSRNVGCTNLMHLSIPKDGRLPRTEKKTLSQRTWRFRIGASALVVFLAACVFAAQDQGQQQQGQQDIPDAPSAVRPVQPFPSNLPPSRPQPQPEPEKPSAPPANEPAPSSTPPPMPPVKTIPPGGAPGGDLNTRDDLYRIVTRVNFVLVPVTVKDESGHLVDGLLPRDFNVFEDGKKQELKFFTSDPFPLSAAVILDSGIADTAVQ